MSLEIEVLGRLRVLGDDGEIDIERPSRRRLLSILALEANHRIGTETLIDHFWGDAAPETARAALQTHVSALRKLLPDDVIATEGYGYRLDVGRHRLDADEFTALAVEAQQAVAAREWETALTVIQAALELWRGRPYSELEDDEFARPEITRLEELHLELLELKAESLLGMGRNTEVLPELERLVMEHPLRERLWEHLMTARYRLGRRAEAIRAYREAEEVFAEMGLEPGVALRRLEEKILLHDEELTSPAPNNLPVALTKFIGREDELAAIDKLISGHRMVTLTGVGGSGKTRLALEAAGESLASFPDGCWLAELAALRDPELIAMEVAAAIGMRPEDDDVIGTLTSAIGRDTTLVILDNCEHLLEATAAVARTLLEAGPDIKVLATSREPLRVPGEVVYEVPPMSFPADGGGGIVEIHGFDAVRLFEERASLAQPSFTLDTTNAASVVEICRRLDGIPLAIELAAARMSAIDAGTIGARLDDRFRFLTGGSSTEPERHKTLEAAIAWSYDLLDAPEQLLFTRLSVFRGGFTLEMTEEVCGGDGIDTADVVSLLTALIDKSLVSAYEEPTGRRYRFLETLRDFAWQRLAERVEAEAVGRRHRDWCLRFADDIWGRLYGPGRWELFRRLDVESDNLQAALDWSLAHDERIEAGRLAGVLGWYWIDQGNAGVAISHLETALGSVTDLDREAELRSRLATALFRAGRGDEAFTHVKLAYDLMRGADPSPAKVRVLERYAQLSMLLVDRDPGRAVPLGEEAVAAAEASRDRFAQVRARTLLGRALTWNGASADGLAHHFRALELALDTGDPETALTTYRSLFEPLYMDQVARRNEPKRIADEMLSRFPPDDERWADRINFGWLAYVFCQSGEWGRAAHMIKLMTRRHLDEYGRTWYFMVRATLRWMQGRLDETHSDLNELRDFAPNPRWYHAYYPLLTEIAADEGRLEDARGTAETYLAVEVDPSEEAKKLAVLCPLVRAEVEVALAAAGGDRREHIERARAEIERMRRILTQFPPPTGGSLTLETPLTYLAFAEAELSRVTGPEPDSWRDAMERADFFYFRLYARWRLAEASLKTGDTETGVAELRRAHIEAGRIGAALIERRAEEIADRFDIDLG